MLLKLSQRLLLLSMTSLAAAAQLGPTTTSQTDTAINPSTGGSLLLSPGAAFREAMRPVEITRASVANWSDIEQASLGVAIKQATVACAARPPADYFGSQLVDLGRLCGLALTWRSAADAASRYIAEETTQKPRLAEAYSILINADLQLKDEPAALKDAQAMLAAAPYTAIVAEATTQAIDYMHLVYTNDAMVLASKRQPLVLAAIRSPAPSNSQGADPAPTVSELYRQALALPELEQLQRLTSASQEAIAALDSALPATLSNDDTLAIRNMRERYALLGKPLPTITPISSLSAFGKIPALPARNAITIFMLFPDWCAQCVRLARQMPTAVFAVEEHNAYMYGLLAQTVAPEKIPKPSSRNDTSPKQSVNPAYAADSLRGTSTLTVPPSLLELFHATDVPLLVVTDTDGIVRLLDVANETALQPGDMVDSAVVSISRKPPAASK